MRGEYGVSLLVWAIKGLTFRFSGNNHCFHSLQDAKREFQRYYQTGQTTYPQYIDIFKNKVSVIECYGRAMGTDPGMAKEELVPVVNPSDPDRQAADESAKRKYLGVTMICRYGRRRYGKLVEE